MVLRKQPGSGSSSSILGLKVVGGKLLEDGSMGAVIEKVKKGSTADIEGQLRPGKNDKFKPLCPRILNPPKKKKKKKIKEKNPPSFSSNDSLRRTEFHQIHRFAWYSRPINRLYAYDVFHGKFSYLVLSYWLGAILYNTNCICISYLCAFSILWQRHVRSFSIHVVLKCPTSGWQASPI